MVLGAASLLVWVGILYAGLWPLNFHPHNDVDWLGHRNGIHFGQNAIVYSKEPLSDEKSHENVFPAGALTIEMAVRPAKQLSHNFGFILSIFDKRRGSVLILGEWRSQWHVRTWVLTRDHRTRFQELGLRNSLPPGKVRFLALTSSPSGIRLFLDGKLGMNVPELTIPAQNLSGRVVLADSATGGLGWSGDLYYLAMFDRALTSSEIAQDSANWNHPPDATADRSTVVALYRFNEGHGRLIDDVRSPRRVLLIPPYFGNLKKNVLILPWVDFWWTRAQFKDIFLNILAFVPLGFLLAALFADLKPGWHRRAYVWAIMLGAATSLGIELTQVYLPMRTSSSLDLLCNTAGTCLGGALFARGLFTFLRAGPQGPSASVETSASGRPVPRG